MIHSKFVKPRIFSWASTRVPEQIDRVQNIGGDYTANREKQYEIGREAILGFKHNTPSFTYTMRQFEFGSMNFWYSLANKENPGSGDNHYITLDDIKSKISDIAAFTTDDNGVFSGTVYFPKLRLNSFSVNVGDPQAIVERNFNLVGEHYISLDGNYLAYAEAVCPALGSGESLEIVLDGQSGRPPVPIQIASGEYIIKVRKEHAGVVTELVETTDFTYSNSTKTLTVTSAVQNDIVKVFYESATAYDTLWTNNDADEDFLMAESCEIYMKVTSSNRIYRLQSIGIDGTFERTDYREVGNSEIVQTGVKNQTVTVNLDRYAEGMTLEKILAADSSYPYYNPDDFSDTIQLMVKIFTDKTHTTFKIGYLIDNLSPTAMGVAQAVQDYQKRTQRLEADNLLVSNVESDIVFA
jgi:hypothetical protein